MNRHIRCCLSVAVVVVLGMSGSKASAQASSAKPIEFQVSNFSPAASTRSYWVTENGVVLEHLSPSAQIIGNLAWRPLQLVNTDNDKRTSNIIRYRINLDVAVAMGFFNYLELGVVLPATVVQKGQDLEMLDRPRGQRLKGGLGDIRIIPKLRILTTSDDVVTLALALPFSVPSGSEKYLLGDEFLTFSPTAILSFETDYVDIGTNMGFRIRRDQSLRYSPSQKDITIGNQLFASLGTKIHVLRDQLDVVGDIWFATSYKDPIIEEIPVETLGSVHYHFGNGLSIRAGAGAGLTRGIGAPAFRVVTGIGYEYVEDPDPDRDGILLDQDECPLDPEDMDLFEDDDGCPDRDNDNDGVLDIQDKCPMDPEDIDKFEDEDGCPDQDNDQDQILDPDDRCPNEAEDKDQFEDEDGCPDNDNDQDGVLDPQDQCPATPEDVDTYQDEDGCPDLDNDQDRIIDTEDKCPLEPEDTDRFEDEDGCPDLDNDGDGIVDLKDECPLHPEVINGFQDEDGCPDQKGRVNIEQGKITAPPVFFATNKDVILGKSFPILKLVAETFKNNPWVKKVRVEGHTDNRGNDAFNLELSKRRAQSVMRFLIQEGVEAERLEAQGFGETQPIASNKNKRGRAKNRRVDFVILDPSMANTDTPGGP